MEKIKPELNKEKTQGQEFLLQDIERRITELNVRKRNGWVKEEDYQAEREKLEEERLEVLTRPESN
ncbi:MAG: hypothetical protein HYT66_00195 [Candidatus Yanofskybacteria bacterium]|nr:hypothetical protein [Candidatus Yanofskybacteria bacterium]